MARRTTKTPAKTRHQRKIERRKLIQGLRRDPRGGYNYRKGK